MKQWYALYVFLYSYKTYNHQTNADMDWNKFNN